MLSGPINFVKTSLEFPIDHSLHNTRQLFQL